MDHDDECDKLMYEGGICNCANDGSTYASYDAEPSNMADLEDGITSSELW